MSTPAAPMAPGQIKHSQDFRYRKQLAEELQKRFDLEPAGAKTERGKRRVVFVEEIQSVNRQLSEISKSLEAERGKLHKLEATSQKSILTADETTLENLE